MGLVGWSRRWAAVDGPYMCSVAGRTLQASGIVSLLPLLRWWPIYNSHDAQLSYGFGFSARNKPRTMCNSKFSLILLILEAA